MTKPVVECAACGAPADTTPGADFMLTAVDFAFDEPDVKLCASCWGEGENDERWNDLITDRVRQRRAAESGARQSLG